MRLNRSATLIVKSLVVVIVAGLVLSFIGAPGHGRSPYVSALSGFAVGLAYAAPYCNDKACVGGSRYNISCGNVDNSHCAKYGRGLCSNNPC